MVVFKKNRIHVLDERTIPLEEALLSVPKGSYVIFSAHGHPLNWEKIAMENHLFFLDCTCPFVEANTLAGAKLEGPFFYFGVRGHLEAEAFLANNPNAIFVDVSNPSLAPDIPLGVSAFPIICQTTLSQAEIDGAVDFLSANGISTRLVQSQCKSTYLRQKAIFDLPESITTLVVLGSPTSNNSIKLYEIGFQKNLRSLLLRNKDELIKIHFDKKEKIALTSGASTPPTILKECYDYLLSIGN